MTREEGVAMLLARLRKVSCLVVAAALLSLSPRLYPQAAEDDERPPEKRRVAVVYSEASASRYFDKFSYSLAFLAAQHQCIMAGVPYDLLSAQDLLSSDALVDYDALILPAFEHVPAAQAAAIRTTLLTLSRAHKIGIVAAGALLSNDESGNDLSGNDEPVLASLLGLTFNAFRGPVQAALTTRNEDHGALGGMYPEREVVRQYEQVWFDSYAPIAGQASTVLAAFEVGEESLDALQVSTLGGRNAHFSSTQILADSDFLWTVLQWVVYGDATPIGLKLGRQESVFVSRTDMDQSMFASEVPLVEIPLLDVLRDWKERFDFVGSFYLNIGNRPELGEFTDWSVSRPIYEQYLLLGHEIGTHSYTHPDHSSDLSAEQLRFEFADSKAVLAEELDITILGGAVPGNPESLDVVDEVAKHLRYLSGRATVTDASDRYAEAVGYLRPDLDMVYFALSMSPDFSLLFEGFSAVEAEAEWRSELENRLRHANQPLIHWLWHDYGPTEHEPGFTFEMFDGTVALAHARGAEFVTARDAFHRLEAFRGARLEVGSSGATLRVRVASSEAGKFSLGLPPGRTIERVDDWYAYAEGRLFLPREGGEWTIRLGEPTQRLTRITKLPMRAELLEVEGDGRALGFRFAGEGTVEIELAMEDEEPVLVSGATATARDGSRLRLTFTGAGPHSAEICSDADDDGACDPAGAGDPGLQLSGDCNGDGDRDVSDATCLLRGLFFAGRLPTLCGPEAADATLMILDANGSDDLDISDGVYLLSFLFLGGPAPAAGAECVRVAGCPDNPGCE